MFLDRRNDRARQLLSGIGPDMRRWRRDADARPTWRGEDRFCDSVHIDLFHELDKNINRTLTQADRRSEGGSSRKTGSKSAGDQPILTANEENGWRLFTPVNRLSTALGQMPM